jgi:pyruvate dehydrogenase E2 component (dihydrolipoamide acetyltransferase)
MATFDMPSLGADMEHGRIVEWKVSAGDVVRAGDIVATVETDKGAIDIEVFRNGVFVELLVPVGEQVPVGTPLARLAGADDAVEDAPEPAVPSAEPAPPPSPDAPSAGDTPAPPVEPPPPAPPRVEAPVPLRSSALPDPEDVRPPRRPRASPSARRLARELGVDLAALSGTGPHGAIKRTDVLMAVEGAPRAAAQTRAPAPTPRPSVDAPTPSADAPSSPPRAWRHYVRSNAEVPHYFLQHDVPVDSAMAWLATTNAGRTPGERLVLGALLVRAVGVAGSEVPQINGFWIDDEHRRSDAVHVGFAVSLRRGGLVAPALRDAQDRDVFGLMSDLRDAVHRARRGGLRASELAAPTITISALGDRGVDALFGLITPPQVALVGFGTPRPRPWAQDGMLGVRTVLTATLSADHRASDGQTGARFLARVADLLQHPEDL